MSTTNSLSMQQTQRQSFPSQIPLKGTIQQNYLSASTTIHPQQENTTGVLQVISQEQISNQPFKISQNLLLAPSKMLNKSQQTQLHPPSNQDIPQILPQATSAYQSILESLQLSSFQKQAHINDQLQKNQKLSFTTPTLPFTSALTQQLIQRSQNLLSSLSPSSSSSPQNQGENLLTFGQENEIHQQDKVNNQDTQAENNHQFSLMNSQALALLSSREMSQNSSQTVFSRPQSDRQYCQENEEGDYEIFRKYDNLHENQVQRIKESLSYSVNDSPTNSSSKVNEIDTPIKYLYDRMEIKPKGKYMEELFKENANSDLQQNQRNMMQISLFRAAAQQKKNVNQLSQDNSSQLLQEYNLSILPQSIKDQLQKQQEKTLYQTCSDQYDMGQNKKKEGEDNQWANNQIFSNYRTEDLSNKELGKLQKEFQNQKGSQSSIGSTKLEEESLQKQKINTETDETFDKTPKHQKREIESDTKSSPEEDATFQTGSGKAIPASFLKNPNEQVKNNQQIESPSPPQNNEKSNLSQLSSIPEYTPHFMSKNTLNFPLTIEQKPYNQIKQIENLSENISSKFQFEAQLKQQKEVSPSSLPTSLPIKTNSEIQRQFRIEFKSDSSQAPPSCWIASKVQYNFPDVLETPQEITNSNQMVQPLPQPQSFSFEPMATPQYNINIGQSPTPVQEDNYLKGLQKNDQAIHQMNVLEQQSTNFNNLPQSTLQLQKKLSKNRQQQLSQLETINEEDNLILEVSENFMSLQVSPAKNEDIFEHQEAFQAQEEQQISYEKEVFTTNLSELPVIPSNNLFDYFKQTPQGQLNCASQMECIQFGDPISEQQQHLVIKPSQYPTKIEVPQSSQSDIIIQKYDQEQSSLKFILEQVDKLKEVINQNETDKIAEQQQNESTLLQEIKNNWEQRQSLSKGQQETELFDQIQDQNEQEEQKQVEEVVDDGLGDVKELQQLISIKTDQIKQQIQTLQNQRKQEEDDEDIIQSENEQDGITFTLNEIEHIIDRKMTELIEKLQKRRKKKTKPASTQQSSNKKSQKLDLDFKSSNNSSVDECQIINIYSNKNEQLQLQQQQERQSSQKKLSIDSQREISPQKKYQEQNNKQQQYFESPAMLISNSKLKKQSEEINQEEDIENDKRPEDEKKYSHLKNQPIKSTKQMKSNSNELNKSDTNGRQMNHKIISQINDENQKVYDLTGMKHAHTEKNCTYSSSKQKPVNIIECANIYKVTPNHKSNQRYTPTSTASKCSGIQLFKQNVQSKSRSKTEHQTEIIVLSRRNPSKDRQNTSQNKTSIPNNFSINNALQTKTQNLSTAYTNTYDLTRTASQKNIANNQQKQSYQINQANIKPFGADLIQAKKYVGLNQMQRSGSQKGLLKQPSNLQEISTLNQSYGVSRKISSDIPSQFTGKNIFGPTSRESVRINSKEQRSKNDSKERLSLERKQAEEEYLAQQRKNEEQYVKELQRDIKEQEMKLQKKMSEQKQLRAKEGKNQNKTSQDSLSILKNGNSCSDTQSSNSYNNNKKVKNYPQSSREQLNECKTRGEYLYQVALIQNQRKKEKAEKMKQAEKKKEEIECTFTPTLISSKASRNRSPVSFQERQQEWSKEVQAKKSRIQDSSSAEYARECTFRPELFQRIDMNKQTVFVQKFQNQIQLKNKKCQRPQSSQSQISKNNGANNTSRSRERKQQNTHTRADSQMIIVSPSNDSNFFSSTSTHNLKSVNFYQISNKCPSSISGYSNPLQDVSLNSQSTVEREIAEYRKAVQKLNEQKSALIQQGQYE